MDGSVPLLHVVGREIHDTSEFEQQIILEAEHGCGSDDRGFGEDISGNLLSAALLKMSTLANDVEIKCNYLGCVELGGR